MHYNDDTDAYRAEVRLHHEKRYGRHRRGRAQRREERAMRRELLRSEGRYTTLYRSRNGAVCGVCRGFAEYYGFDVFWTRAFVVAAALFAGFWPAVIMYFIAALIMKPEPILPLETEDDEEFYHSYSGSRTMALQRLKRTFDNLDRRIQRLESTVTTRDFDWDERLRG
jgi:phage shock protein C